MELFILEFVLRTGLIILTTAMVLRALRIASATAQHAVWAGVLMAMLALPVWLAWGPKAAMPVLPARSEPSVFMTIADPIAPIPLEIPDAAPAATPPVWNFPAALFGVYLVGAAVLLLRLAIGTTRASRLTSASCAAPVTVGLFRPRIILPDCSAEWPRAQLDAVLTHERAHVRRRDPLFQWMALFNRAVFWFHPLAWWLERTLSALAEEACDAEVLERGHDPREYSRYLLDLARAVRRAGTRVNVVAVAMPGSDLPQRVKKIVAGVRAPRISRLRMACAALACAIPAAVFAAGTLDHIPQALPLRPLPVWTLPQPPVLIAQATQPAPGKALEGPPPAFDVTSIRLSDPNDRASAAAPRTWGDETGKVSLHHIPLRFVLMHVYNLQMDQLSGPEWLVGANTESTPFFDILATVPAGASKQQIPLMFQSLLAERFQLKFHWETVTVPVFELVVAKGGPKLKQPLSDDPDVKESVRFRGGTGDPTQAEGNEDMTVSMTSKGLFGTVKGTIANGVSHSEFESMTMENLAQYFSQPPQPLGLPVVDMTGLKGSYQVTLDFPTSALGGSSLDGSTLDSLRKQGLDLVRRETPRQKLVIDHIEKIPTEN